MSRSRFDRGGDYRKDRCHGTLREYSLELRERATRMALEARADPALEGGAPDRREVGNPPRGPARSGRAGRDRLGRSARRHHRQGPTHQGAGEGEDQGPVQGCYPDYLMGFSPDLTPEQLALVAVLRPARGHRGHPAGLRLPDSPGVLG